MLIKHTQTLKLDEDVDIFHNLHGVRAEKIVVTLDEIVQALHLHGEVRFKEYFTRMIKSHLVEGGKVILE